LEVRINPPGWELDFPKYLGYTNPIWLAPVICELDAGVTVDEDGNQAYLSRLTCHFYFSISLQEKPVACLELIKGDGRSYRPDELRNVLNVGIHRAGGIEKSHVTVGLARWVELVNSTDQEDLEYDLRLRRGVGHTDDHENVLHNAFVLYLVTPVDTNGNRLNSIAVVFDLEAVIE
jgi:hypothetical protein